eukprot:TRINITY_DN5959_c0_g1_i1.p2 TRINITY_DN5959_c0_g1~~TRINITY_DN5959_c0_g1_i1.p2  ORF type:complete len:193 (+),score=56.80 TRINITY_DN5959_c0_g1_i1:89-667(+)
MFFFFFFKQKTAYEMLRSLVGSEMCIRDRYQRRVREFGASVMEECLCPWRPPACRCATSSLPYFFRGCNDSNAELVRTLITEFPSLVTAKDDTVMGGTGVHYAAAAGSTEVLRALVQAKADLNATDRLGATGLHYAAHRDKPEAAALLLGAGANLELHNEHGDTALMVALKYNHRETATVLEAPEPCREAPL